MTKKFEIKGNDISDGYHTFDELYEHRCLLYLNLCLMMPHLCVWKKDYETWFCLYLNTMHGQISYHIPDKFMFMVNGKIRRDDEFKWDGHTSAEVAARLLEIATLQSHALIEVKPKPIHLVE
jgi:hypothetical protein